MSRTCLKLFRCAHLTLALLFIDAAAGDFRIGPRLRRLQSLVILQYQVAWAPGIAALRRLKLKDSQPTDSPMPWRDSIAGVANPNNLQTSDGLEASDKP